MKGLTIFLATCVAATVILAAPPTHSVSHRIKSRVSKGKGEIKSIIELSKFTLSLRDGLTDLIERELGKSPTAFLQEVNALFGQVNRDVKDGSTEMDKAVKKASFGVRTRINIIKANAMKKLFAVCERFILDLGKVLFRMPNSIQGYDPIADKIRAILCKTLKQFLENILTALLSAKSLLESMSNDLLNIAEDSSTNPEVAAILEDVVTKQLYRGRLVITPMIDVLSNLLDFRMGVYLGDLNNNKTEHRDLFHEIVFEVLGFSAQTAAYQAKVALSELSPLRDSTRKELMGALSVSDDNQVQIKVMDIYDTSMNSFIQGAKSMHRTFEDLTGAGCDGLAIYNLMGSLPGVGMDYFTPYINHEFFQMKNHLKTAFVEIEAELANTEPAIAMNVSLILRMLRKKIQEISEPLMNTLQPILKENTENTTTQLLLDNEEEDWLEPEGQLYNRDILITTVSNKLGFKVVTAAETLKASLENTDSVMGMTLSELDTILEGHNTNVQAEILGIMNTTLIDVSIVSQPMVNVLLAFLPDGFRSNKHIALDIYNSISGVDIEDFVAYCSVAVKEIKKMNEQSMNKISKVTESMVSPEANEKIKMLLDAAQHLTISYMMPFLNTIKPILAPDVLE